MVFSSLFSFVSFAPELALYYVIKNRTYRNWLLIISSLVFYAWGEPVWITLLIFSTLFDYFNALVAGGTAATGRAKPQSPFRWPETC